MFDFLHTHAHKVGGAVAVLCVGAIPHLAMALPANEIHETFYDGPNFQKVVGKYFLSCYGHPKYTGTPSEYSHYVSYPCSNYKNVPVDECLFCPNGDPAADCTIEPCPLDFFHASDGKLHSSRKSTQ
jgi:hypothetical protein